MTDGFSWDKYQKKQLLRLPRLIVQLEKSGNGDNVMQAKLQLKRLKRRVELQKTVKDVQKLRSEVRKVA